MNAPNVKRHWRNSHEKKRLPFGSPLMIAHSLRLSAAAHNRATLVLPARRFAPLLSPQKVSEARHKGGAVGDVSVQMLADPENAMRTAMHLLGVARSLSPDNGACMLAVLCAEQRDDSAEDIAQGDLLADPDNPKAMREYLRQNEAAQAALAKAHEAVTRRLARTERGER